MADVATPSRPRNIPGAGLTVTPPAHITIPSPVRSGSSNLLTLDTFSPVTQNGSFEFHRIVKQGEVLKRTRKTKSWKPIYMVLRPHLLSIYRDKQETKLRHQIDLSDLTAVARQKDPKRKDKHVFGLFSPSRNYHLEAYSHQDAQDWVEHIRREARIDRAEEEMYLASPGGAKSPYQGFERSIDSQIHGGAETEAASRYSSSDVERPSPGAGFVLPKRRDRGGGGAGAGAGPGGGWGVGLLANRNIANTTTNATATAPRQSSYTEYYSGAERGSFSDFSDGGGGGTTAAARLSALSLAPTSTDGRPSTSSAPQPGGGGGGGGGGAALFLNPVYGQAPTRPSMSARSASQMSGLGLSMEEIRRAQNPQDEERVVYHGWIKLLKSKSGVRQWKKVWLVLRPRGLALYKNEDEYSALLILPMKDIIDAVEIDPISRTKTTCMQVITEERNYRFCTVDEEALTRCLGALKSLLAKRKAREKEGESGTTGPTALVSSATA